MKRSLAFAVALAAAVVAVTATGSNAAAHSCTQRSLTEPVWSPTATEIAWVSSCKSFGSSQVWLASADGSSPHMLKGGLSVDDLVWSPRAGLLYTNFLSHPLWRLSRDGTLSLVARDFMVGQGISMDAAGNEVAWDSSTCSDCASPVYVKSVPGGRTTAVAMARGFVGVAPTLSPDGTRVAYERRHCHLGCGAVHGIWISRVAGGPARRLAARGSDPEWSPDGRSIAYDDGRGNLVVVAPDGTPKSTLTGAGATPKLGPLFKWSPDSSKIAVWFHGLTVYDTRTGGGHELSFPKPDQLGGFSWAPDSKALLVATEGACPSLWSVSATGSGHHAILHAC